MIIEVDQLSFQEWVWVGGPIDIVRDRGGGLFWLFIQVMFQVRREPLHQVISK